jgi:hypothetical protein
MYVPHETELPHLYLIKVMNGIFCLSKEFTFVTMSLSGEHGEGFLKSNKQISSFLLNWMSPLLVL